MPDEAVFGNSPGADSMAEKLAQAQRERAKDRGRFNQYGMRDDPRGGDAVDGENPGNGENPRRFGAGGDVSSYANREALRPSSPGETGAPNANTPPDGTES